MTNMLRIDDVAPDRAMYRPGERAGVTIVLANEGPEPAGGRLVLTLAHLGQTIARWEQPVEVGPRAAARVEFTIDLPRGTPRGYGLDVALLDASGADLARGSGALDVLERWSQAPRYGFLSDFAPGQADVAARCDSLCRYHLNVVQFYDWMWRHYALLPPADAISGDDEGFTDALGRRLALATVRAAVAAVRARGGAALAYGAVYGAEPEYADAHPELALFDEDGKRVSLAELFYIMNIAPGSPWLPLIVAEFARAVRELEFDGIHLDQYGFPKTARTATGELVDLSEHFPPLIDAARAAVVAERPDAGVIFNAVGNWPIETVAPTGQDVVYIEVWPPDEYYDDLRRLIGEARRLSGGKQVILAAYLSPFGEATAQTVAQAEAAALLATAAIAASGGSHLLLGERDGILCDPYYPKYATLRPEFARLVRAYYDFLVRYEELLVAPDLADWQGAIALTGARSSARAEAGAVWTIARHKPGYLVVHLINLAGQADTRWNAPRTPPQPIDRLALSIQIPEEPSEILVMSPDAHLGRPQRVRPAWRDGQLRVEIARLQNWAVVVLAGPTL